VWPMGLDTWQHELRFKRDRARLKVWHGESSPVGATKVTVTHSPLACPVQKKNLRPGRAKGKGNKCLMALAALWKVKSIRRKGYN